MKFRSKIKSLFTQETGIVAVVKREFNRMLSRPIYLVMTLVLPIVCYTFFTSMMSDGMPTQLPIAVVDMDNSALSRSIIRKFNASPQTKITTRLNSYNEGKEAMQRGDVLGFIVFPTDMQADAMAGRQPEITFYTTNSYLISGSLLMRDLSTITAISSASLNIGARAGKGQSMQEIAANVQPIALDFHAPGNPWTNYSMYLSTILSHGLLQILILLITVYIVGIEIKQGTSKEWIERAGGGLAKALTGKLLPYTFIFSLMTIAGNTLFFKYLHFTCEGSFAAVLLAGVLMVIAYQAIAVFLLGLLTDFKIALTIAGVFGVLGISFSGLTFPIEIMDTPLQGFSRIFPIRYYFFAYIDVALHGLSFARALPSYIMLVVLMMFPFPVFKRLKRLALDTNSSTVQQINSSTNP